MTDTIWPPDFAEATESKYIVLIQSMRTAIRSGVLDQGYKMPPVRELAWQLGIPPGTVARAYKMAAEEGLVEPAVGRGTFVSGGMVKDEPTPPPLIHPLAAEGVDFRAIRVPNSGQDAVIRRIMAGMAERGTSDMIDYPTPETDYEARDAVTGWIEPERGGRFGPDDVILGLGAQNAVNVVLQAVLHGTTPVIMTEELAYPGWRHAARLLRAEIVGIEMDDEGIRPDRFEEALRKHGGQVLITAAEVQSPTTTRTTLARRQEIARLARKYQVQIIEDDCHCITRPDIPNYRALCPERGWYVSSLTKAVSAAVRFGFIIAPEEQAGRARQVAQSTFYGLPQPMLDLCAELITSGEAERFRAMTEARGLQRVKSAVNLLGQWDIRWRPDVPFIWLRLPQGWRGSSFARACGERGIRIKAADEFSLPEGRAPHAVRVGLNPNISEREFEKALSTLSGLLAAPPVSVDL